MKQQLKTSNGGMKRASKLAACVVLMAMSADLLAGGGTLGDAAQRGADNIPAIVTFFRWLFGAIGLVIAGLGILAFFKKGQPPEVGKNIGMMIAGAILFALPWLISTTNTSIAGSDESNAIQGVIIE